MKKPEGPPNVKVGHAWPDWLCWLASIGISAPLWGSLIINVWYAVAPW